ncbi:MAG: PQQ-binding-like beta-propeller repeat protein [Planctomycetota bacterium]|nr:PQQ-binding-like beta-propeller repeat protein [Planctomycetota bacterium]
MWRFDAGRTAASTHDLPARLSLRWIRHYEQRTQVWDDPLNNDLMQFDRVFEPIVVGNRVYVGFNDSDKIVCWDLQTGDEVWRYYTDGPVRFPPVGDAQRILVVSDDGYLYCLRADDGQLEWKFRGGPTDHRVLGNRRLISMWPARGGPVVRDGTVYFAAGIWPWLGTFVYALDIATGTVQWVNEDCASQYIQQPHSAPAFAGVAPQGALAATQDYLVVPGGRSAPAVFHRRDGSLAHFLLNEAGKGTGGGTVIARQPDLYVHTRVRGVRKLDLMSGKKTEIMLNEPVLADGVTFTSNETTIRAFDHAHQLLWEFPVDGQSDLIQAGRRLYAAGERGISVIELGDAPQALPRLIQSIAISGVARLIAGGDSLIAITLDGKICVYSTDGFDPPKEFPKLIPPAVKADSLPPPILADLQCLAGYAIMLEVPDDPTFLDNLLDTTQLHVVVVAEDISRVDEVRKRYDDRGQYGSRVSVISGAAGGLHLPPYIAHAVILGNPKIAQKLTIEHWRELYESVRPYGGVLWYPFADPEQQCTDRLQQAKLPRAEVSSLGEQGVIAQRIGSLEGSAPWTHLYGNIANTVKSNDRLVRAPLGILWFGGNSHEDVLPRHSHSPCEQVIGGRLFVEGMNSISARDVYTGRPLWKREFADLGTAGIYFDASYKDTPLDTAYNQKHIPGANLRGTNYVATEDAIYLALGAECHVLDPNDGHTIRVIQLPALENQPNDRRWTYIGVYQNLLLAGTGFGDYAQREGFVFEVSDGRSGAWNPEWYGSRGLMVFDRHTGNPLWNVSARYSFLHNGIVAGDDTIFLLDKLPQSVEDQRVRRGQPTPHDYRILALDARQGSQRWERTEKVFGTWLSYSESLDLLLQSGAASSDRSPDEVDHGVLALRAADGTVVWENSGMHCAGPPILHHDRLIGNSRSNQASSGMLDLKTGQPVLMANPLTGKLQPWTYTRQHGCNTAVASEYLITFRSGSASFYDLNAQCGVGNLGGFRSGCSSNLIAADGILNAPDFTRTCSCGYQNQTSLGLVYMPDVETWTVNSFSADSPIQRIGINFGAPGTRKANDGTLWVEYPPATPKAPLPIGIRVLGEQLKYFRRHSSVADGEYAWVIASGVEGIQKVVFTPPALAGEPEGVYTVRCYFAGNSDLPPRRFSVSVPGTETPPTMEFVSNLRRRWELQSVEIRHCKPVDGSLEVQFHSENNSLPAILGGIELVREGAPQ